LLGNLSAPASADVPPRQATRFDVAVIGAGLVGLAGAMELLAARPGLRLVVLEKEDRIAAHQSGHNSGVLHAGLYYAPGSLKARYCRAGRAALIEFADEHGIRYHLSGKLVVAASAAELPRLQTLAERGRANGLTLTELGPGEFAELEPNIRGVRALHVAESGVIDFRGVAHAYADVIRSRGGEIRLGEEVRRVEPGLLETTSGMVRATAVVACGGLQADRLAGAATDSRIVAFRGDYYTFKPHTEHLVRGLVYPVPDPSFPFLGVHFTRHVDGRLTAGPNAVPALAREGYSRRAFSRKDTLETLRHPGFRRLARTYAGTGAREIWRDLVKPAYVAQMRRYLPMVEPRDVSFGPSGVRAQVLGRDGSLVDDFLIAETANAIHVINAPSPAATASLVIGRHVAERALALFSL
jgi:(S)-2-hydroxyglutarate dehydrogenase